MRERAEAVGWLRRGETPLFARLAYPLPGEAPGVDGGNRAARDRVLERLLSGDVKPTPLPSLFGPSRDVLVAEVDGYGLPVRTVLCLDTGLMRTDPYYDSGFLAEFYCRWYRKFYNPYDWTPGRFLGEQVIKGEKIWGSIHEFLPARSRVLDFGCGMGGMLLPFRMRGHQVLGCDLGDEYLDQGRKLGLKLVKGDIEAASEEGPYNLVILSHVLEHLTDPARILRQIATSLAAAGLLYVEVPGVLDVRDRDGGDLIAFLQNAHAWHFTSTGLRAVLESCGFEVLKANEKIECVARYTGRSRQWLPQEGQGVLSELKAAERILRLKRRRNRWRSRISRFVRTLGLRA